MPIGVAVLFGDDICCEKRRSIFFAGAFAVVASFAAIPAANAVTITLTNVQLSDGGVLNGSISTDPVYGGIDASNLQTSGGSLTAEFYSAPPVVINNIVAAAAWNVPIVIDFFPNDVGYFVTLQLAFSRDINTGNVWLMGGLNGPSYECDGWTCPSGATRFVNGDRISVAPSVAETPSPTAWILMLSRLMGLGFFAHHGTKTRASIRSLA